MSSVYEQIYTAQFEIFIHQNNLIRINPTLHFHFIECFQTALNFIKSYSSLNKNNTAAVWTAIFPLFTYTVYDRQFDSNKKFVLPIGRKNTK